MDAREILSQVLKYTGENRSSLARKVGLIPQRLHDIARGKTKTISYEIADKITGVFPEINKTYLLTGDGPMLLSASPHDEATPVDNPVIATEFVCRRLTMNEVKDRVLEYIAHKGITVRDFERAAGLANGYVNSIRRSIGPSKLADINRAFPDLNRDWLLFGDGPMLLPASSHDEATPVDNPEIVYLPIVPHSARAGTLGEYEQLFGDDYDRKQPVLVTKQMHGRYLCFRVEGDSMEPVLLHGDVVMARHIDRDLYKDSRLHLRSWSVWIVVTHHDGILIKSIADHDVEGGTLRLHSLNPLYPDQTVRMQDVIDVYNVIEIVSRHL